MALLRLPPGTKAKLLRAIWPSSIARPTVAQCGEEAMAASDESSDRYDPWYVKVVFGLFLSALVGFLAVLYGLPYMIVAK